MRTHALAMAEHRICTKTETKARTPSETCCEEA